MTLAYFVACRDRLSYGPPKPVSYDSVVIVLMGSRILFPLNSASSKFVLNRLCKDNHLLTVEGLVFTTV